MTHALWHSKDLSTFQSFSGAPWEASGVSIDTRTLSRGDLFIALNGKIDGHLFVREALAKGASAAFVQRDFLETLDPSLHGKLVPVDKGEVALQILAQASVSRFRGVRFGLTGSVGKTTLKEGFHHLLGGECFVSHGNFNNHLGLPLSLSNLPPHLPYGIFELGMNHAGELRELAALLRPHITLLGKISYQHGAHFSGIDAIAVAKSEILCAPVGIISHDSHYVSMLKEIGKSQGVERWITYGRHKDATVRQESCRLKDGHMWITAVIEEKPYNYTLPMLGDHWRDNSLALLAGVYALGADLQVACNRLAGFTPVYGRGKVLTIGEIQVVDHSYNAAPAAMKAALEEISFYKNALLHKERHKGGKVYALLGEMAELGTQTAFYHDSLLEPILAAGFHGVWLCGRAMKPLGERLSSLVAYGDTVEEILPSVLETLQKGDILLVKGSRGSNTSLVIYNLYLRHMGVEAAKGYPLAP